MGPRIKRRQFIGSTDVIEDNFSSCKKRIPQQGTFFQLEAGRHRNAR